MHCIEPLAPRRAIHRAIRCTHRAATTLLCAIGASGLALLSACGSRVTSPTAPVAVASPPVATATPRTSPQPAPHAAPQPAPQPAPLERSITKPPLLPLVHARNWDEFRVVAAKRMVAANPGGSYMGQVPDPLLAIPVLEIELHADGSVRNIAVLRHPRQAKDTVQLAMAAVHRAAPYGDVSKLPRPWKFVEVFLFDDNRKFKPRSLDQ